MSLGLLALADARAEWPARALTVTTSGTTVEAADLDGDGDLDLPFVSGEGRIQFFETDGGRQVGVVDVTGDVPNPCDLAAADLDGDGDVDLVAASSGGALSWLEHRRGGFAAPVRFGNGGRSPALDLADLDGDGRDDLVVTAASGAVSWYPNLGAGGFGPRVLALQLAPDPAPAVHGDLDGDGDLDLATATASELAWSPNLGGGRFGPARLVSGSGEVLSVAIGDLDADGDLDLAAGFRRGAPVRWYRNDGVGGFGGASEAVSSGDPSNGRMIAADADGDGDPDLVTGSAALYCYGPGNCFAYDPKLVWIENRGGTFADRSVLAEERDPWDLAVGDLDGDGDPDLVVADLNSPSSAILVVDRGATGWDPERVLTSALVEPSSLQAVDLDGDGDPDVLGSERRDGAVGWWENLGASFGLFRPIADAPLADRAFGADLDGDGDGDVLSLAAIVGAALGWFPNQGRGAFGAIRAIDPTAPGEDVVGADFDLDGDVDVVSVGVSGAKAYTNAGGGRFARGASLGETWSESVTAPDLDGDGRPDLLLASVFDHRLAWQRSAGVGFGTERVIDDTRYFSAAAAADLDGDGDADVVGAADEGLFAYAGDGAGGFGPATALSLHTTVAVLLADLDVDGDPDVVAADEDTSELAWHENLGASFAAPQPVASLVGPTALASGDLDGDGDPDLLSGSVADNAVVWHQNPRFSPPPPPEDTGHTGLAHTGLPPTGATGDTAGPADTGAPPGPDVLPPPDAGDGACGCASGDGSLGGWAFALLAALSARRRASAGGRGPSARPGADRARGARPPRGAPARRA